MNFIDKERKKYIIYILKYHNTDTISDIERNLVIQEGELVNYLLLKEILNSSIKQVKKIFNCSYRKIKIKKFYFEFYCNSCNKTKIIKEYTLQEFIDKYLKDNTIIKPHICKDCKEISNNALKDYVLLNKEKIVTEEDKDKLLQTNLMINTISYYTNPYYKNIDESDSDLYDFFFKRKESSWYKLLYVIINKLSYDDFLKTKYWEYVRNKKFKQSGHKCEVCNCEDHLQIHHKTYTHHGMEHLFLDDLSVLCYDCHKKIHDYYEFNNKNKIYLIIHQLRNKEVEYVACRSIKDVKPKIFELMCKEVGECLRQNKYFPKIEFNEEYCKLICVENVDESIYQIKQVDIT